MRNCAHVIKQPPTGVSKPPNSSAQRHFFFPVWENFLGTVSLRLLAVPAESRRRHGGLKKEKKKERVRPKWRKKRRKMKRERRR